MLPIVACPSRYPGAFVVNLLFGLFTGEVD
jgi:hypothetical protein